MTHVEMELANTNGIAEWDVEDSGTCYELPFPPFTDVEKIILNAGGASSKVRFKSGTGTVVNSFSFCSVASRSRFFCTMQTLWLLIITKCNLRTFVLW